MKLISKSHLIAVMVGTVALTSCTDTSDLRAQSLAYQKQLCASKGKQFLWKDTKSEEGVFTRSETAEGHCVGPGERGFEAPTKDTDF
ncbi:MAG TPA: hypothetical protein VHU23_19120 [Rhizomicrobium sp.]|jgi:hypothetical protein|nr:hypothetical protein [Rhizomicrobium sp.]